MLHHEIIFYLSDLKGPKLCFAFFNSHEKRQRVFQQQYRLSYYLCRKKILKQIHLKITSFLLRVRFVNKLTQIKTNYTPIIIVVLFVFIALFLIFLQLSENFCLKQISKTGNLDSNLIQRQYNLGLMTMFMAIKSVNPKLGQDQMAKELSC